MRPVRITGVTGDTQWVPLDTYSPAQASVFCDGAAVTIQYTLDNPFDTSITPEPIDLTLTDGAAVVPPGARAVRATGIGPTEILIVSQQGIA